MPVESTSSAMVSASLSIASLKGLLQQYKKQSGLRRKLRPLPFIKGLEIFIKEIGSKELNAPLTPEQMAALNILLSQYARSFEGNVSSESAKVYQQLLTQCADYNSAIARLVMTQHYQSILTLSDTIDPNLPVLRDMTEDFAINGKVMNSKYEFVDVSTLKGKELGRQPRNQKKPGICAFLEYMQPDIVNQKIYQDYKNGTHSDLNQLATILKPTTRVAFNKYSQELAAFTVPLMDTLRLAQQCEVTFIPPPAQFSTHKLTHHADDSLRLQMAHQYFFASPTDTRDCRIFYRDVANPRQVQEKVFSDQVDLHQYIAEINQKLEAGQPAGVMPICEINFSFDLHNAPDHKLAVNCSQSAINLAPGFELNALYVNSVTAQLTAANTFLESSKQASPSSSHARILQAAGSRARANSAPPVMSDTALSADPELTSLKRFASVGSLFSVGSRTTEPAETTELAKASRSQSPKPHQ